MFGYYGKVPGHGDFVRSRADVDFVSAWDSWLQESFAASRAALGDAWQGLYEAAPLWRFALGQGVCGARPMLGVMMPSQDRVGRTFPLTIFARLTRAPAVAALDAEPLMTALEDAALSMLADGVRQDSLRARLDQLDDPQIGEGEDGVDGSSWLSTFFGGAPRRDVRSYGALPPPARFVDLLNPTGEAAHV